MRLRSLCDCPESAFTLLELLLVMVLIAILASFLLPALARAKVRAKQVACVSQLRQMGLAFHDFAHDHDNRFPMQVSTNLGGSQEFVRAAEGLGGSFYFAFRHFQVLSNQLVTPQLLVCPADHRLPATDFGSLRNENVSYFVGVNADFNKPDSILAGDWNIASAASWLDTTIHLATNEPVAWTTDLHDRQGNVLFADARVERLTGEGLQGALGQSGIPVITLLPPVRTPVPPATNRTPASPVVTSALDRIEGMAGSPARPRAQGHPVPVEQGAPVPPAASVTNVTRVTNRPAPAVAPALGISEPDVAPHDLWPLNAIRWLVGLALRLTFLLLLLVLLVLTAFEVMRRRRAKKEARARQRKANLPAGFA